MRRTAVYRAGIVDDEPLARRRLARLLADDAEIEVAFQARNAAEAIAAVERRPPDLLFLDVEMPGQDGFSVLDAVQGAHTVVIFVTAHGEHALRAFDTAALDYLLKPFDAKRLSRALARAKERLSQHDVGAQLGAVLQQLQGLSDRDRSPARLLVREGERAFFIQLTDVDWIEAESNYVRLHMGSTSHLLREPMGALEARLDRARFRRIHRSSIVNLDRIRELQTWFHGEYRVMMCSGAELRVSRRYRKNIEDLLGPD
jgi:two-component system, LytTR family, response regulator